MLVFYESSKKYIIYNGITYEETKKKPKMGFYLIKPYEANKENLKIYYHDMIKWLRELSNFFKIDYETVLESNFTKLLNSLFKLYECKKDIKHDKITEYEYDFFEKCFNGGLNSYEAGDYKNVKAYDFSKFYPNILAGDQTQKQIPYKKGKLYLLDELPAKLQYGIYRVKIISNSPNISKLFAFNKENYYTHEDIKYARELSFSKYYNVDIELINDGAYNALIYTDLIETKKIFIRYVKQFKSLNEVYPKNKLSKLLLSMLWGHLSRKGKTVIKTQEEINNMVNIDDYHCLNVEPVVKNGEFIYNYKLIHKNKLNMTRFRLKVFLTSFGRCKMARKIQHHIKDVVYVCTDGVIFKNGCNVKRIVGGEFKQDDKYHNKNITIERRNKILIN